MPPLHGFSAQATEVTEVRFFGGNDHEVGGLAIVLRLVPDVAAMKATSPRFHVFVVLPSMVRLTRRRPLPAPSLIVSFNLLNTLKGVRQIVLGHLSSHHDACDAREAIVQSCPNPRVDDFIAELARRIERTDSVQIPRCA
jgi:hypothetical protein